MEWNKNKMCQFYVERLSFAKPITILLVMGNTVSYENKEIMIDDGDINIQSSSAGVYMSRAWPTIFIRPDITHFEEKNSRPDFKKIICVKVK